jgi:hypothetical protein
MATAVLLVSLLVAAVSLATGVWGSWLWWRFAAEDHFWLAIRGTQIGALLLAVLAGVVWVSGADDVPWLFWLYCLLPVAISLIAEQLRIIAAEQVLERRGLDGAADVAELDEAGQRRRSGSAGEPVPAGGRRTPRRRPNGCRRRKTSRGHHVRDAIRSSWPMPGGDPSFAVDASAPSRARRTSTIGRPRRRMVCAEPRIS